MCMQRAQRNVPVYLREQQKAEEKAQEKLLLLNEQQKDKQHMDEEQVFVYKNVFQYFHDNQIKCVFRNKVKINLVCQFGLNHPKHPVFHNCL